MTKTHKQLIQNKPPTILIKKKHKRNIKNINLRTHRHTNQRQPKKLLNPTTNKTPNTKIKTNKTEHLYTKHRYRYPQKHKTPTKNTIHLLLLLLGGDVETNPGPMPDILSTHPPPHKSRNKTYFIPYTIKLQPEYQHLAKQFSPCLKTTHPNHITASIEYPHLSKYIQNNQQHPPQRILYALITTISPSLETCNHQLIHISNPNWTTKLLEKMALLQNPPERHISTPHPYTEFINNNQNLINPPNTIHKQLYKFIRQNNNPNSANTNKQIPIPTHQTTHRSSQIQRTFNRIFTPTPFTKYNGATKPRDTINQS